MTHFTVEKQFKLKGQEIIRNIYCAASLGVSEGGGFLNHFVPDTTNPPHGFRQLSQAPEEQRVVLEGGQERGSYLNAIPPQGLGIKE